jgi:integrase
MIEFGWSRQYINRQVSRIRQVFYWAVKHELIDVEIATALAKVSALQETRTTAPEMPKVRPVPRDVMEAICPFVTPPVATMMRIQANTGMRPDEVCSMRPADIEKSVLLDGMWRYRPLRHKTQHHGHKRMVLLNAAVQALLKPFLDGRAPELFLFSPAEALTQSGRKQRSTSSRAAGDRYSVASYRRAIERACRRAFPVPDALGRKKGETQQQCDSRLSESQRKERDVWIQEHRFHPHQLRHLAATEVRAAAGADAVLLLLGVRSTRMVDLYAEKDAKPLAELMQTRRV